MEFIEQVMEHLEKINGVSKEDIQMNKHLIVLAINSTVKTYRTDVLGDLLNHPLLKKKDDV